MGIMNERYDDRNNNPCLFEYEIKALANIALTTPGEIIDANHTDIQDPNQPQPHFFRLELKPENIDSTWRLQSYDPEIITNIVIEYNEAMMIIDDDEPMEPWVTVSVATQLYDSASDNIIDRRLRYRLSLIEGGICNVTEERSDENKRANIDVDTVEDALLILASEPRPLNEDDLKFLRYLISQR
ncbi:MAG: hypothetical protein JWM07_190 [Candidatus Saccharibacteria bacterium]|nr:hypothetical protein [Candidatus Saccharibacteria bacterium]